MKRTLFLVPGFLSLFVLAGCINMTGVQTGYVSDRDQCRTNSENEMGVYSAPGSYPMSEKEKNTALLTLFCECMKQKDWKVAGCPKPKEVAKPATPPAATTVVVVQAPAAAAEQPEACPAPNAPPQVRKAYKAKHPKSVCPTTESTTFDDTDTQTLKKILGNGN